MAVAVDEVRQLLNRDRIWTVYALGDLDPRRAEHCRWYASDASIALLYEEFETPILFAAGDPAILEQIHHLGPCYLQIPANFDEPVEARYQLAWKRPMLRLGLDAAAFPGQTQENVQLLDPAVHEAAVRELYADGRESGEEPDFFMRSQMLDGTFYGVWQEGQLVAAGGTHLYSQEESIGAIGNIYTHRAYRGRGYAKAVTAAITATLLGRGIRTIALNVKSQNAAALRVYNQLGFRFHCSYWEGFAAHMKNN